MCELDKRQASKPNDGFHEPNYYPPVHYHVYTDLKQNENSSNPNVQKQNTKSNIKPARSTKRRSSSEKKTNQPKNKRRRNPLKKKTNRAKGPTTRRLPFPLVNYLRAGEHNTPKRLRFSAKPLTTQARNSHRNLS